MQKIYFQFLVIRHYEKLLKIFLFEMKKSIIFKKIAKFIGKFRILIKITLENSV